MPPKLLRRALLLPGSLALIIIVFSLAACRTASPVTVSTTRAVRQNLTASISSNGKVEPIEPYAIQSQLTTFIETVSVKQGDIVRGGQILMTLNAKDLETELARLKGELFAAEDEHKIAAGGGPPDEVAQLQSDLVKTETEITRLRLETERLERLLARQAATPQELEQSKIALQKAEADKRLIEQKRSGIVERAKIQAERSALRSAEARRGIEAVQEKLNSARVTAPANATVFSLSARAGTFVHMGDVLAELADLTHIRVRAFVDEPELGLLKEGQTVEITWDGLPGRTWMGEVERLPKAIVARGSRNVGEVLCSVANANSDLLPNTNVDVRIRTAVRDNILALPRSAIRTDGNRHYVFIVEQGRLQRRDVSVGISNTTHYEILSGVNENDQVALPGAGELREGMAVTVS